MTRILANRSVDTQQLIFDSYKECSEYFKRPQKALKNAVETGDSLRTDKGMWFFDILEENDERPAE